MKKTAARNIEQIVQKLILGRQQSLLMVLFKCNEVQIQKEDRFVCKLWLRKVFKAWKEETIFIKIEKEKQAKEMRGKEE